MENVIDLDILRPKERKVKLAGVVLDVSYIPCGITFEVDATIRALAGIDQTKLGKDENVTKKGFDLTIELCSIFASVKHPEMTPGWFKENCSLEQINVLANTIKDSLNDSYLGVERYGKN